jgi:hypothetical protein
VTLKYSNRPVLLNNGGGWQSKFQGRLPAEVMPINTAPAASATPVVVYESNGRASWALQHRNGWKKLVPFRDDFRDRSRVTWRMDGTLINNPVAWSPKPLQRKR